MRYRITTTITVNGVPFKAGDEADDGEIPAGSLASLLRLRQAEEIRPDAPPAAEMPPPEIPVDLPAAVPVAPPKAPKAPKGTAKP